VEEVAKLSDNIERSQLLPSVAKSKELGHQRLVALADPLILKIFMDQKVDIEHPYQQPNILEPGGICRQVTVVLEAPEEWITI
jgi:hypothetical protein